MKSITLLMALMIFFSSFTLQAQKDPAQTGEKKFQLGIGFGLGISTQIDIAIVTAITSAELQGEYKSTDHLSLYGSLGYNRFFAISGEGGSEGYGSLLAGARGYLTPKFFIGIGAGVAYFADVFGSNSLFNFNPHIGLNGKAAQFTLGYNGLSQTGDNLGFVEAKVIIKFNKQAR